MSGTSNAILVFGAAGAVGRAAATSAAKRGAKVWLAMRDTSKHIQGLSANEEKEAGFERVQADLTDPASVKSAVTKSKATIAFVYAVHTAKDHMKSTFEAMKDAGITDIIMLSSVTVRPSAEAMKDSHFIPRVHALSELALIASGIKYVAVRPAYFNSNVLWDKKGIQNGEVNILGPEIKMDFIAPEDIGAVVGTLMTTPSARLPENEPNGKSIYLCGPKLMDRYEAMSIIGKVLGKDIKVKPVDADGFREMMKAIGTPEPIVESIITDSKANTPPNTAFTPDFYGPASENVRKYAEKEPMSFVDWVEAHKSDFE